MTEETTLHEWLLEAPFTLCLSASFFGFYSHAGALRALSEAGAHPVRVAGCSAGAIVASLYAAGVCAVTAIPPLLLRLRSRDILTPPWRRNPLACFFGGGVFRIRVDALAAASPCSRLEDAARCPVAISTFCEGCTVTHRSGNAAEVVAASCAVPGLMRRADSRISPPPQHRERQLRPLLIFSLMLQAHRRGGGWRQRSARRRAPPARKYF